VLGPEDSRPATKSRRPLAASSPFRCEASAAIEATRAASRALASIPAGLQRLGEQLGIWLSRRSWGLNFMKESASSGFVPGVEYY
jgi:hypothetical protein